MQPTALARFSRQSRKGFLWPAIHGGHPAGRRYATLKMTPGHFLWPAIHGGHPVLSRHGDYGRHWRAVQTKKLDQAGFLRHGVLVTQLDQLIAVTWLEQQVTQHPCSAGLGRSRATQKHTQRTGQLVPMARSDKIQRLAGRNHQHIHRFEPQATRMVFSRNQPTHLVKSLKQFDIAFQTVDKGAVEHMPTDLRQARRPAALRPHHRQLSLRPGRRVTTDPDYQHPRRAKVQGWADRRGLAHGAIAEVFAVDLYWREYQRNRGTGQQMLKAQTSRHTDPTMAEPGVDGGAALIESHRLASFITKGCYRHRTQLAMAHGCSDPTEIQLTPEQISQRRAIEQRHRYLTAQPEQAEADKATGLT